MPYAPVHGLQLYYETHGEGPPLVMLHGGLLTFEASFGAVWPDFAQHRQVIGVELQGHGHTADIERDFTLAGSAADVAALLDHLGLESADVFGFSLGGLVSFQLALDQPGRINRLVIAATHFRPDGYHEEITNPALWATSTRMPTPDDFLAMKSGYEAVAPDPAGFDAFAEKVQPAVHTFPGWTDEQVGSVVGPTLVLVGDHDFVRLEHAAEFASLLPAGQLGVLPGTAHMQVSQQPEVVPMVERFLTR